MRLACGEGNGVRLGERTSQNTASIARTAMNVVICRTFLRSVLLWVIDRQGMVTDRSYKYRPLIDRVGIWRFAGVSDTQMGPRSMRAILSHLLIASAGSPCILLKRRTPATTRSEQLREKVRRTW